MPLKTVKTIYLHIGTHKTGTTSIQNFCTENTEFLKKQGYIYPKCCWYYYGHHRIPFSLKKQKDIRRDDIPDFDTEISELKQCIDNCKEDKIVISSEEFSVLKSEAVKQLMTALNCYNVYIVLFLRRQDHLLLSIYNQQIKDFNNKKFVHYAEMKNQVSAFYPSFNYNNLVKTWEKFVGKERMIVCLYNEEGNEAIKDFLCSIDFGEHKIANSEVLANQSINPKALEMVRISKSLSLPKEKVQLFYELGLRLFKSDGSYKYLLTRKIREEILSSFIESNTSLQKEYFPNGVVGLFDTSDMEQYTEDKYQEVILKNTDLIKVIELLLNHNA
ncbi:MAG: hypothetical protein V1816_14745 [Pseudomonadota bacterium]